MSKKDFEYKKRLKHLDLKKIQALDKLAGKIGIIIGALLLLVSLIVTLIRGT